MPQVQDHKPNPTTGIFSHQTEKYCGDITRSGLKRSREVISETLQDEQNITIAINKFWRT